MQHVLESASLQLLRRARVAAQIDFLAHKFRLETPAVKTAILAAFRQMDQGHSAAAAYACGEQAVKRFSRHSGEPA